MNIKLLKLQDSEASKNSFYRSPKVTPTIIAHEDYIEIKTIEDFVFIYKLEETVLSILTDFKFIPVWLVQQWFEDFENDTTYETVQSWINTGLIWTESSALGVFIRPTKFLLELFKETTQSFVQIPFGLLNHTCSEEQLMFDIRMGNEHSEMWQIIKDEDTLPCYHPLHIKPKEDFGTICIREGNFKLNRFNPKDVLQKEEELRREIKSGKHFTSEFSDFSLFPIVTTDDNNKLVVKTPDVLVPLPRKNMLAQSYAIEIELSSKPMNKYIEIMKYYKDNIKFGKCFYLCSSNRTLQMVKTAFKEVGGLGTCQLYCLPFAPPSMKVKDVLNAKT